ncbi:hypothetical protein JCM1841_001694 [Sporobolomyces salmonicolor]
MSRDLSRSLQRSLGHLKPPPTKGGKFGMPIPTHFMGKPAFVQVKDRIPYWHIAPGDRVKIIRGDASHKGKVGVVASVSRETNRVYLQESEFARKKRQFNEYPGQQLDASWPGGDAHGTFLSPISFHVSNLRLQVRDGADEYTATRVRKTKVTWDRRLRRFAWKRYALVPQLGAEVPEPGAGGADDKGWREVPWPAQDKPASTPGPHDTTSSAALRATFLPDLSALSLDPKPLRNISGLKRVELPAHAAPELAVSQLDLGGLWHSRAKQTERWNEAKKAEKAYGKTVMKAKAKSFGKGEISF